MLARAERVLKAYTDPEKQKGMNAHAVEAVCNVHTDPMFLAMMAEMVDTITDLNMKVHSLYEGIGHLYKIMGLAPNDEQDIEPDMTKRN